MIGVLRLALHVGRCICGYSSYSFPLFYICTIQARVEFCVCDAQMKLVMICSFDSRVICVLCFTMIRHPMVVYMMNILNIISSYHASFYAALYVRGCCVCPTLVMGVRHLNMGTTIEQVEVHVFAPRQLDVRGGKRHTV
jgi:hypothetical protein